MQKQMLHVEDISKRYGGVQALNKVRFDLNCGEVHALVGENGAGKSTLVNVLGGIVQRDEGRIILDGQEVRFAHPSEAHEAGIAIIHQEIPFMPSLSVIENLFLGRMRGKFGGLINWRDLERRAYEAMARVDLRINPYTTGGELTTSQRQLITIARVLSDNAKLIIMDEPNSSLSQTETDHLFEVIKALQAQQIAIIYVSHKIEEVLRISDRITVFRDGQYVGTVDARQATENQIITMMVGREIDRSASNPPPETDEKILEVRHLSGTQFHDVSFDVRRGEIVGFSGLVGSGRTEVARAIFGADRFTAGEITFTGKPVRFRSPRSAIRAGMAMVPDDRKEQSLFMGLSILQNMSIVSLPRMAAGGVLIRVGPERKNINSFVSQLDIRLASVDNPVSSLSGGNQQKTILGRWLATEPQLLILDEPTHGVDVGAKAEIYELVRQLAKQGHGIILISSELPEILMLAHRIVVMHEGRVTALLDRNDADEERLMAYATGLANQFADQTAQEHV